MKLLRCNECRDVVSLRMEPRVCFCGKSSGHYLEDGWTAVVSGPCITLGMDNHSFAKARTAAKEGNQLNSSRNFLAWVFLEPYERIQRE